MWDGSQWWLGMQTGTPRLQAIAADGTPGAAYELYTDPWAKLASLAIVPSGLAAFYTRPDDATAGGARRAFVRVLTEKSEPARGRAVRH